MEAIGTGLRAAFPAQTKGGKLTLLTQGANSTVVESLGGHVFRVGRRASSFASYQKEARLLPLIRGRVGIVVPLPDCLSGPAPQLPCGAVGYPKLPGRPLSEAADKMALRRVADQVAEFIYQLHAIPVTLFGHLGLPEFRSKPAALAALWEQASPHIEAHLAPDEFAIIHRWVEERQRDTHLQDYRPCLIHGDLSCWNILVDEATSTISGVVDFELAGIGDPAEDLLTQSTVSQAFLADVLSAYRRRGSRIESSFEHRVLHLRILRLLFSLVFHAEAGEEGQVSKSIRKLRASTLFTPH